MSARSGESRSREHDTATGALIALCDEADSALLLERARILAAPRADAEASARRESYIRVRLGDGVQYGIAYRYAEEIIQLGAISRVPCTPSFVRGVINRRGEMLTVIDLRTLFQVDSPDQGQDARIVVVSGAGIKVGLLVDEILDNDEFDPEELDAPLDSDRPPRSEHVMGLHDATVALLDLDALLADRELFGLDK